MKKIVLLCIAKCILFTLHAQVQTPKFNNFSEVVGKAPTIAQFLRYDELPVNEYTGIPSVTIPLYEIKVDEVKLPITMSYHAGGLKVTQEASWVGLGWDIPTIASITQIVKDEDDLAWYNANHSYDLFPDWMSNGAGNYSSLEFEDCWLYNDVWQTKIYPKSNVTKQFGYFVSTRGYFILIGRYVHQEDELSYLIKDSEPDIFKITINGETLNCIINRSVNNSNPRFIVLNKKGYIVNYSNGWEIIDPYGVKYYFNTKSEQKNLSMQRTFNVQSAVWYVDRIISTNGKEIKFNYLNSGTFANTYKSSVKSIQISMVADMISTLYGDLWDGFYFDQHPSFNTKIGYGYQPEYAIEERQIYLQSIEFPWGTIDFSLSARTDIPNKKKLDKITVKNKSNQSVKEISFAYVYYSGEDTWSKKLKLNSLQIAGENPYQFTYNAENLPTKNSYATDYWGYYNGNTNNKSLAPNPLRWRTKYSNLWDYFSQLTENTEPEITRNNHSAKLQYTKAGILEKIQYPTGGKTVFEYGLNEFTNYWVPDYDSLINVISKGNGLRINEIKYIDSDDRTLKREKYSYFGGKTIRPIDFFQSIRYNYTNTSNLVDPIYINKVTILQCSNSGNYADNPLSSFDGVGYDKVIKTTIGQSNDTNGQIETLYYNTSDMIGPLSTSEYNGSPRMSLPAFKNTTKPVNGSILKRIYYNNQGNRVNQEDFEYSNKESSLYYGVKIGGFSMVIKACPQSSFGQYGRHVLGYYPIFDFESLLTRKTETQYMGNDSIAKKELFNYNTQNLLSYQEIRASNDKPYFYSYKYPSDYNESIYKKMAQNNRLSTLITFSKGCCQGDLYETHKVSYTDDNSITNGLILPQSEIKSFLNGNGEHTVVIYNKYDSQGNILQVTNLDNTTVVYLWGYKGMYPIAEIQNATYSQVQDILTSALVSRVASANTPAAADLTAIKNLRTNTSLSKAMVTVYEYKPLVGILKMTDPRGVVTDYVYDDFGRLKQVLVGGKKESEYQYHYKE